MLTTSHAVWTARLTRRSAARRWAVLGGVAPDLPAAVLGGWAFARGHRGAEFLRRTYQRPGVERVHLLAHSALVPALVLLSGGRRRRAVALGWAGHLACDLVTHHDDAWPHLYPLSRHRLRSPVSYWQRHRHARAWSAGESAALAAALLTERERPLRAATLLALAAAAWPLARPGAWTAHGCATDRPARP